MKKAKLTTTKKNTKEATTIELILKSKGFQFPLFLSSIGSTIPIKHI